jgi:hypothetical protein
VPVGSKLSPQYNTKQTHGKQANHLRTVLCTGVPKLPAGRQEPGDADMAGEDVVIKANMVSGRWPGGHRIWPLGCRRCVSC